ncbi:DNA mismatch repair protein MutS [candidate division KSB1 bacterium]|nr:DNA mismatch repair protein MutS [candidate division KSB1 bacterium]
MEQYITIKKRHKSAILFFRMGDFYEMFYEDARIASEILGIALTSRAHGKSADVPLAGFPHHALDSYLAKFIKAGYRVAICEQLEDPRQAKTVVKRDVVEIVTPGTAVSDDLLDTKRNNYLMAVYRQKDECGVANIDVSTGSFQIIQIPMHKLTDMVESIDPTELLLSENQFDDFSGQLRFLRRTTMTRRDDWTFHHDYAYEQLVDHFGTLSLKGFGIDDCQLGISAAGAILAYLKENQKQKLIHINKISRFHQNDYMIIDSTTRRNLELFYPLNRDEKTGTLVSILDQTKTPMGARLLVNWISFPLMDIENISQRLEAVETLYGDAELNDRIRDTLKGVGDLERLLAKFATGRANGRDAKAVSKTLSLVRDVKDLITKCNAALFKKLHKGLYPLADLVQLLDSALVDHPPLTIHDGGMIRKGYNEKLDELCDISHSGKDWIARLQIQERERTGIPSLKVNYNKVFGYYIDVTKPHLSKVPKHYIRKQTLVNSERYITQELKEYEEKILGAEEKIAALEYELFDELRQIILKHTQVLQHNAFSLAVMDCTSNLAFIARENNYVKPGVNGSDVIDIKQSRHPVVEKLLPPGEQFVANDVKINNTDEQLLVITGPNMAGKSTYIRQIGLIVLMAQMGSFVPAMSAQIGVVDRLFTRVGASDNLAAGESTFLREMNETANILNNATAFSLILLDEIGRGTSTFDGLSIAWAVTEYIHNTTDLAAKTVFATHYHELTELELILPRVKNYNVAVKEWGDHIVFLRKIVPGGCDHSYGIQVAQLAGLPKSVIRRAKEILHNLEKESLNSEQMPKLAEHHPEAALHIEQMNLFEQLEKRLQAELKKIDPNTLTPIQALNKLEELKQMIGKS